MAMLMQCTFDNEVTFAAGLLPSFVQMFVMFPLGGQGIGGYHLGIAMPLFVILFNTVFWSFPAYAWFTATGNFYICHFVGDWQHIKLFSRLIAAAVV